MDSTAGRVPAHTQDAVNRIIRRNTESNIQYFAAHPKEIDSRLAELDREWDIERSLEANAASITVAAVLLGLTASRKWFLLPGIVGAFLLQHAVQGWCPPLPLFRRLGVRTQTEIEDERHALKALRNKEVRNEAERGGARRSTGRSSIA
jgi:hypothetical protein